MRTWIKLMAAVLLIAPLTPALLHADPELPITKDDFKKLSDKIDKLQKDMTDNSLRGNRTVEELRAVREELQRIRELLEIMAQKQGAIQREARYGPGQLPPNGAPPATGTIVLQNDFSAPATVNINGKSYRVDPYQTHTVRDVPIGSFQYYVDVGGALVEPPRSETLRPGGYRIRVYARPPF